MSSVYATTKKVMLRISLFLVFVLFMVVHSVSAEPNRQINYQGKLTDGSGVAVPDGAYNMRFWLLQSTSQATTSAVWTESLTGADQVQVTNGLFSVMLGSTSPLTSVDFNQTLYLGVEIGGTGAPAWDGEMSPRKPLGTVPAAFESLKLGGVASSSFLRSDEADSIAATTASSLLTINQSGAGDILNLLDGGVEVFTVLDGGNVGIGTTSPYAKLSVAGAAHIGGNLTATGTVQFTGLTSGLLTANSAGVLSTTTVASSSLAAGNWSNGRLLMASTTATGGFDWVATSTLGIDGSADNLADNSIEDLQDVAAMTENYGDLFYWNGSAWADIATSSLGLGNGSFLGLSDTPGSFTSNAIPYVSGSALTFDSTFVYDGTNLGLGTASPGAMLDIFGTGNSLRLSYDGSNYAELSVNSSGVLSLTSTGGTGSGYTLGSGLAEDTFTLFDGNALDFYFGLDDSDDTFKLGTGSTVGANVIGAFTSATSTFNTAIVASTTATSTFTNGIALSGGCFQTVDGNCLNTAGDTSVVVAASDSSAAEKAYADYVADGTSDEIEIQQAIDYVYANGGGGTVYLLAGNFEVSTSTAAGVAINMATSTRLVGQGAATVLKLKDSNDAGSVAIVNAQNTPGVTISNFKIDANQDNQSWVQTAVYLEGSSSSTVSHMEIVEAADYAINVETSSDVRVLNSAIHDSAYGVRVFSSDHAVIQNNNLRQLSSTALYLEDATYAAVTGNAIMGSSVAGGYSGEGINVLEQSMHNNISDNHLSNLAIGIKLDVPYSYAPSHNTIANNIIVNVYFDNEGTLGGTAIALLSSAHDNTVIGNKIETVGGSGILLANSFGGGTGNMVSGNHLYKTGLSGVDAAIYVNDNIDAAITANTIYSTSTYAMIEISSGASSTLLAANHFENPNSANYIADAGTDTRYNEWDRTTITTDTARGYNLFSIIGSTTATSAAITQLGTGDILALNNASGRVFTVNNSGSVGIGTSSPSSKLSVFGGIYATATTTSGQFVATNSDGYWIDGTRVITASTTANNFFFAGAYSSSFASDANYNYAIGDSALRYLSTGGITADNNFAVGRYALQGSSTAGMSGHNNTALGYQSLYINSSGAYNNAFGYRALYTNGSGSWNNAIGHQALRGNTTGSYNNALGRDSLYTNTTGSHNNALGQTALRQNSTGSHNNAIGYRALYQNTSGTNNSAFGEDALYTNTTGSHNAALGYQALQINNVGSYNAAIGYRALYQNTSGSYNIGLGRSALQQNNTGWYNTAIGYNALAANNGTGTISIGYQVANNAASVDRGIFIGYDIDAFSTTEDDVLNIGNLIFGSNVDGTGTTVSSGNIGIGTSSPNARLSIQKLAFSGAGVVGLDQYLETENSVDAALQYGNRFFLNASNTATTTIVGSMLRLQDSTTYGNTVRALEVQANRGDNTYGENTAISAFGRTFGVRAVTTGEAGDTFEPAAGFFETEGTAQGNAIRAYTDTLTTASLLSLFQSSSTFAGTGLEMNFGNGSGSFSSTTSKYLDFQNGGTSVFTVTAYGTTTIGDGTTNHLAGLQIGFGGICVDNDGSCTASTSGRITAVESLTGNSDLAEMYFSSTDLEPGEVVALDGELSIDRAAQDSDLPVLGVVSTKPGLLLGFDDTSLRAGERGYPLALSGRVPVKLSTENGPIKRGDSLMLSSLPGVAMKATGTGITIGIALEDFDDRRKYSETYLNQFGDDMVDPVYEPIYTNLDPRLDDGCYYGGGNAVGDEPCVPLVATTTQGQIDEANDIAEAESIAEQMDALRDERSEAKRLADGTMVKVGRVVMFVDRSYRWFDDTQLASLGALFATSSVETEGDNENETIFDRLVALANRFVDGVLSVFTLKADRVETSELCVDGVCVTADDLRTMLNTNSSAPVSSNNSPVTEGESESTDETVPEVIPEPVPAPAATTTAETTTTTEPVLSPVDTDNASSATADGQEFSESGEGTEPEVEGGEESGENIVISETEIPEVTEPAAETEAPAPVVTSPPSESLPPAVEQSDD